MFRRKALPKCHGGLHGSLAHLPTPDDSPTRHKPSPNVREPTTHSVHRIASTGTSSISEATSNIRKLMPFECLINRVGTALQ